MCVCVHVCVCVCMCVCVCVLQNIVALVQYAGFEIYILNPDGNLTLNVQRSDTIEEIKYRIQEMKGHLSFEQTLIYNGEELEDMYFLSHYNIVKHATIELVIESKG